MENKEYFVAIDLGSSNVVVAVGSKTSSGKVEVEDVSVAAIGGQGVVRGEIKNIEDVAKAIKEAVDEVEDRLGIKIIDAYTGISGQHIKCAKHSYFVFVGRDGEIREEDVQKLTDSMRNVQAPEGQKILHIIPQNYIINDEEEVTDPVGMFGKKLEATFNFIIGHNQTVQRLEKALLKVDIKQSQMFLNPLVAAEAVVLPDEKELGVVVLDMGAGTTDLCIYCDRMIRHVAVIPVGSDAINKDIRAYGILERYVEDLKTQYGSAVAEEATADKLIKIPGRTPREISFKNLSSIIQARVEDILDYVMAEIKHSGCESKLGAGIVITGGGAKLKNIDQLIKNYTGMDVRIAVADNCVSDDSLDLVSDPRLSTSVGILMSAIETGKPSRVEIKRATKAVNPQPTGSTISTGVNSGSTGASSAGPRTIATGVSASSGEVSGSGTSSDTDFIDDPDDIQAGGRKRVRKEKGPKVKKERRNPFKGFVDGFTKMFDVIDDNEI